MHYARTLLTAFLCLGAASLPAADNHGHDPGDHADHDHDKHDHADEKPGEHAHEGHVDEVKLTADAVRSGGITVATAAKKVLAPTFIAPARVAFNAEAMAHVGAPVKGRVVELKAKIGQVVKKDDELAVIESPELGEAQSDLIQKRSAIAIAELTVEPARQSYERAKKLFDENQGIALAEVQKRMADWKAAEGAVKTAVAAATSAENRLELLGMDAQAVEAVVKTGKIVPRYIVRAPIGGSVIQREVTQGELVNPDRESLLVLADMSVVWVWADVPEARLAEIKEGSKATVHLVGDKAAIGGTLTHIAAQLDPATRTAHVRIEVPNPDRELRPGMFARAELETGGTQKGEAVLVVPEVAVQIVEGKPAVVVPVKGEPNTFARREVTVAKPTGGMVPVLSGLAEGEKFVATGSFLLKADLGKSGAGHEH